MNVELTVKMRYTIPVDAETWGDALDQAEELFRSGTIPWESASSVYITDARITDSDPS